MFFISMTVPPAHNSKKFLPVLFICSQWQTFFNICLSQIIPVESIKQMKLDQHSVFIFYQTKVGKYDIICFNISTLFQDQSVFKCKANFHNLNSTGWFFYMWGTGSVTRTTVAGIWSGESLVMTLHFPFWTMSCPLITHHPVKGCGQGPIADHVIFNSKLLN